MPKTIKNIYDNSVSFENLLKAHKKANGNDNSNNDIAPFKSILNEMYAKDTSKKNK